jgi:putative endonuclease
MPTARTRLGDRGEEAARQFLQAKGYQVLAAKYRCQWGEVDLVAQEGDELVFVEVRTRRSAAFGTPEESLTPAKVRHLLAACQHYLQQHQAADLPWRIDLVSVRVWGQGTVIDHLRHAVEA